MFETYYAEGINNDALISESYSAPKSSGFNTKQN